MNKPEFTKEGKDGNIKVFFVQEVGENEFEKETMWCIPLGDNYKVDNIPFIAKNVSAGDIITVEWNEDEKVYYFDDFVSYSGNSTVRIILPDADFRKKVSDELITMGCETEGLPARGLLAVNIPRDVDYRPIKEYLKKGRSDNHWDFEESCLSDEHREQIQ